MKKCEVCGKKSLEVIGICPQCLLKAEVEPKQIQKLKQISDVLSITVGTDENIKECMKSLLNIIEELKKKK